MENASEEPVFSAAGKHDNLNEKLLPFSSWLPIISGALIGVILRLIFSGKPDAAYTAMAGAFILLVPMAVGATTVFIAERQRRRSWWFYALGPVIANTLFVLGTLVVFIEGLICAIIIIPLFSMVGALGGILMGLVCRNTNWPKQALGSFVLLPLLLGIVPPAEPDLQRIAMLERKVLVQASPEQIWQQLHKVEHIRADEVDRAWMYRIGVPLPVSGVTQTTPEGLVRRVTMGKEIYFDQVSNDWKENRYVLWKYRFFQDSFPANALDDHVSIGGRYFDLIDTRYSIKPVTAHTSELAVQIHYRVSTEFNWYADLVARLLIADFEEVILDFYKQRAAQKVS
ncbi:SRPBCC domain-containing protein [Undibacterium sp. TS12]|uniref:SRPBCC domain-containing protein n=1 Tax=Undibacterium sp. TS12 TaxID=2908202 RepID=UPI001F4C5F65|nr:SRPBCC domain-containing protein [Undibacterium sp. TS12]MCH8619885.1 SRPBCC domain-containing protein [Undibacterium sp. TS12]